jgi:hypothetical protein
MPTSHGQTKKSAGTFYAEHVPIRYSRIPLVSMICNVIFTNRLMGRKWILVPVPSRILSDSKPIFWQQERRALKIQFFIGFRWNTSLIYLPSLTNAIVGFGRLTEGWRRHLKRMRRLQTWWLDTMLNLNCIFWNDNLQMREIAEIELAIQGGTEKIEQLGGFGFHLPWVLLTTA